MARHIYGLLVGIDAYADELGPLRGSRNDVDAFHAFLKQNYPAESLHLQVLKDEQATRANVVRSLREQLGKATADDVALFQFCGHGARSQAAREFLTYFPEGKDEGLVCFDSRSPGQWDLADKELAVLIDEVAKRGAHVVVLLDCCHSGSGTRDVDDFTLGRARHTHEDARPRPLETYLDGYYSKRLEKGEEPRVPTGRHLLLAACDRAERAWEGRDGRGVFTSSLIDVLQRHSPQISYADLFVHCRHAVKRRADSQTPQLETYGGASAYGGFLAASPASAARRYSVAFEEGQWRVACGAVHGIGQVGDESLEWWLYPDLQTLEPATRAFTTEIGPQWSAIECETPLTDTTRLWFAERATLPVPALSVLAVGDATLLARWDARCLEPDCDVSVHAIEWISDALLATRYEVLVEEERTTIRWRGVAKTIQTVWGSPEEAAPLVVASLGKIVNWERLARLQNPSPRLDPAAVVFDFIEILDDGTHRPAKSNQVTFDVIRNEEAVEYLHGFVQAENRTGQSLHFLLLHLSDPFSIQPLYRDQVPPTTAPFTIPLDGSEDFHLTLDDNEGEEANHHFKLIVSTSPVDDFTLLQPGLAAELFANPDDPRGKNRGTRGLGTAAPQPRKPMRNDWFCHDIHLRLAHRQGNIDAEATLALEAGRLKISPHPQFRASVHLGAARATTRTLYETPDIVRVFERQGGQWLNLAASPDVDAGVLELTDIHGAESLATTPLELTFDMPLAASESLVAVASDGEQLVTVGTARRDASGTMRMHLGPLPELSDPRRAFARSLRLYFFKQRS